MHRLSGGSFRRDPYPLSDQQGYDEDCADAPQGEEKAVIAWGALQLGQGGRCTRRHDTCTDDIFLHDGSFLLRVMDWRGRKGAGDPDF